MARLRRKLTRRRFMLRALIVVAIGAIIAVTALYLLRSRSVLFRLRESGDPAREPSFSVFNPFRDQDPERCAEAFLKSIKAGQCQDVMSALAVDQAYRQYVCEMERDYPLASWLLKNRTDADDTVKMFYWYWHQGSESHDRLWVMVEKRDAQWHVTGYERYY
jgi:hypothetical protein